VTLQDPKVSQLLKRHFVALAVDIDNAPKEIQPLFGKIEGKTLPFLLCVTDRGQFLHGTSGARDPEQLVTDLTKALANKAVALPKSREADLGKQLEALQKALDANNRKQANTAFQAILRLRGYNEAKDKAHDLMDATQAEGVKQLRDAVGHARKDEYDDAGKLASQVAQEFAGLPVAEEAKEHLAALKLLETAHQLSADKKGNWKQTATQRLNTLLSKHGDTPYATLAQQRLQELRAKCGRGGRGNGTQRRESENGTE
jgi:hypothetical protein